MNAIVWYYELKAHFGAKPSWKLSFLKSLFVAQNQQIDISDIKSIIAWNLLKEKNIGFSN